MLGARGAIVLGMVTIVLGCGGFLAWAAQAPLSSAAVAPGEVVLTSYRKTIQHLEGGIVSEILVRDGMHVEAGTPLLRLDGAAIEAEHGLLLGRLATAQARRARLLAEQAGDADLRFPSGLMARRADAEVAQIMAGESQLFDLRRRAREGETEVLRNRISQAETQIGGLRRQIEAADRQIVLIGQELAGKRELAEKGYASAVNVMAVERELARLEGVRGEAVAEVAQVEQAMNEAQLQIINLETGFREEVQASLAETEEEVFDTSQRLAAVGAQRQRLTLTAPVAGEVMDVVPHTVGGVIAAGSKVMDIVPRGDELVVEARVRRDDIDSVHAGLAAQVRLSAYRQRFTPKVDGTVVAVSAARLRAEASGGLFYRARIVRDEADRMRDMGCLPDR